MLKGLKKLSIKSRKNLKLASVVGMSVFSLIAVVTACVAWFSKNPTVYAEGIQIAVDGMDKTFSVLTVHRCRVNESSSTLLKFNSEPVGLTKPINLEYYSQLNQSQPVLMLFKTNDGGVTPDQIKLSAIANDAVAYSTVNFTNASAANYYTKFPLSSAARFLVIPCTTSEFDFNNVIVSDATTKSFVSVSDSQMTWSETGRGLSLFSQTETGTPITYLAVIIDYYPDAINLIIKNSNPSTNIKFACDFSMVVS